MSKGPKGLESRFLEPTGYQWGSFDNGDGATLRYGWIEPSHEAHATAIVLPGRQAPIEKYFEITRDLLVRGYAVWSMDWRGQGGSQRYLANKQKGHSLGFESDARDLHQFVTTIVGADERPVFLIAESMGAHIALRYLLDEPSPIALAVLLAPMLEIDTRPWPGWAARALTNIVTRLGLGSAYVPGGVDWTPNAEHEAAAMRSSSDPIRAMVQYAYFRDRPELRLGNGPTFAWLAAAFDSWDRINRPHHLTGVRTPVLLISSMADTTVVPAAHERICRFLPNSRLVQILRAGHELLMESDDLRDEFFTSFDKFATELLAEPALRGAEP